MRATIHLVSARDCVRLRPVVQSVLERGFAHAPFDVSRAETETLLEVGRRLTSERSSTRRERARRDHQHPVHIAVPRRTAHIERAIGHDARWERRRNRRRENWDEVLSAGKADPAAQS